MLILTRRIGQAVVITTSLGEKIKVFLCNVGNGNARIGFDAGSDVTIHREEIQNRIDEGDEWKKDVDK